MPTEMCGTFVKDLAKQGIIHHTIQMFKGYKGACSDVYVSETAFQTD